MLSPPPLAGTFFRVKKGGGGDLARPTLFHSIYKVKSTFFKGVGGGA